MECIIQLNKMLFHVHLYIQSNLLSHFFHFETQHNQLTPFESRKGDSNFI
jgi:hypothetical protein